MKRLLFFALAIGLTFGASADTTMQIRNGVLTTDMNGNNFKITNLAAPTDSGDAATKGYADSHGGGPGNGTTLSSLILFVPTDLFANVTFDTSSSDVTGTLTKSAAPVTSFYGNPSTGPTAPIFMNSGQARTALSIQNVDNTSDANKPVSGPTLTAINSALANFAGTANITTLGTITTGTWQGSVIGNTYLPTLDSIRAPAADLSLASKKIINLAAPVSGTDAANKTYVDGAISTGVSGFTGSSSIVTVGTITSGTWHGSQITSAYLPTLDAIASPVANVSLSNQKITNLADPSSSLDATNKQYVDSVATAGPPHPAVAVATTANITRSAEQTIDGVTTSGSRILVKNQTTGSENGIYVTAAGSWTRATDADANAEMSGLVFVTGGTTNLNTQWGLTTPQPITLGTTALTYSLTASGGTIYTAGNGLTLTGNQFSALGTTNRISVGGGTIDIASNYVGQSSITTLGTTTPVTTGTWNASIIAGQYGGTGFNNTGKTLELTSATPQVGGSNTGDVTLAGENYLSRSGQVITANAVDLSSTNVTGTLAPARFPTGIVGDVTVANVSGTLTSTIGTNKVTNNQLALAPFKTIKGNTAISGTSATTDLDVGTVRSLLSINNVENVALSTWDGASPIGVGATTSNITKVGTLTNGTIPTSLLSGTIATTQIADKAVTYAKIQQVAPARLLGNPSPTTSATPSEIPLGPGLAFNAGGAIVPSTIPAQIGTNSATPITWGSPNFTYTFIEGQALNPNRTRFLPLTSGYKDGDLIYYIDAISGPAGNYGPIFIPQGTDTFKALNPTANAAAWTAAYPLGGYQPFTAGGNNGLSKSITFERRGADWRVYSLGGEMLFTTGIQNPANLTGVATFNAIDLTLQPSIYVPNLNSTLVVPTEGSSPGVVHDIGANGVVAKSQLAPSEIIPNEYLIGSLTVPPTPVTGITFSDIATNGSVDTIRIAGNLTGNIQVILPPAGAYQSGQTIAIVDGSGTVGPSTSVTLTPATGNTVAGIGSFVFTDTSGRKEFTSDGGTNWSVSQTKVATPPYIVLSPVGGVITLAANQSSGKQNVQLNLASGINNLKITGAFDGMDMDLIIVQPLSGLPGSLGLPAVSRVGGSGAGLVTLTSTNPAVGSVDVMHGRYNGNLTAYLWDQPILNYTSAPPPAQPTGLAVSGTPTSGQINLTWTDNATNETGFSIERATGVGGGFGVLPGMPVPLVGGSGGTGAYSDRSVAPGISYTYRIQAINSGGSSSYYTSAAITSGTGGPPADVLEWHFNDNSPSGSVAGTGGLPNGTMTQPSFSLVSGTSTNYAFNILAGMAATANTSIALHGTSTPRTTSYTYQVVAYNAAGKHNAHTAGTTALGPALVDFVNSTNFNTVSWTAVTGADHYEVYRTLGGTTQGRLIVGGSGTIPAGTTTIDDTNLTTDTTYNSALTTSNDIYTTTTVAPGVNYATNQVISVSFWINTTSLAAVSGAAVDIISGGVGTFRIQAISGSRLQVTFPGGNALALTGNVSDTALNTGTWHNVVVVMDNSTNGNTITNTTSDNIRVYFDGSSTQRTVTYTVTTRANPQSFVNANVVVGSSSFTGLIDDVRIYKHALTTGSGGEIDLINSGGAQ